MARRSDEIKDAHACLFHGGIPAFRGVYKFDFLHPTTRITVNVIDYRRGDAGT